MLKGIMSVQMSICHPTQIITYYNLSNNVYENDITECIIIKKPLVFCIFGNAIY